MCCPVFARRGWQDKAPRRGVLKFGPISKLRNRMPRGSGSKKSGAVIANVGMPGLRCPQGDMPRDSANCPVRESQTFIPQTEWPGTPSSDGIDEEQWHGATDSLRVVSEAAVVARPAPGGGMEAAPRQGVAPGYVRRGQPDVERLYHVIPDSESGPWGYAAPVTSGGWAPQRVITLPINWSQTLSKRSRFRFPTDA